MLISAGTTVMMTNTGMKQTTIGKTSLTGNLAARSSVSCVRLLRISDDWTRSVSAIETPCFWACIRAETNWRISGI